MLRALLARLAAAEPLRLVLVTGNTFEYARRVEEPLALRTLAQVDVIAEGGLVCRSLSGGPGWCARPEPDWAASAEAFGAMVLADPCLVGRVFPQGNEVRCTWKPVADKFSAGALEALAAHAVAAGLSARGTIELHPLWFDASPDFVRVDGVGWSRPDKGSALRRWVENAHPARVLAVGDSSGDVPMFELADELGGDVRVVANGTLTSSWQRTRGAFTSGVIEAVEEWARTSADRS